MIGGNIDKYRVIDFLGNGHFGHVYLCHDPYLQREFAIKVIKIPDPEKFVNAVKEGRALDACRHPHTVDVKDVRQALINTEPVVIIVMEYLSRGSIQKHIEKRFITVQESCRIMQQALLGLENAHNNSVLHRDIKPGNILFGDNGEAKLSDFGLAIDYHTELSDVAGYKPHQPLEVIEGNPMDKLSDIYASGITLYRLLNNTNSLPFFFKTKDEWIKAVKKDLFPPRQFGLHIPIKVIKVLQKAIHKSKSTRFQNCTEFRQALETLRFFIDWTYIDNDNWTGRHGGDTYDIVKFKKRTGWFIDFKKNGIRRTQHCCTNVPDDKVDSVFFEIIRKTTIT